MIDRQQLAEALGRLDPRDREVLDYSLRRHVPDSDLATLFGCGPADVARMRAAAVERLADDLGVQRGADLGHVLTALLEESTWQALPVAGEPAAPPREAGGAPVAPEADASAAPEADPASSGPEPGEADADASPEGGEHGPVLGMLGGDGAAEPEPAPARGDGPARPAARRSWPLVAAALIAALVTVGLGAVLVLGDDAGSTARGDAEEATRPFVPRAQELGEPFPAEPESAHRYPIAIVEEATVLLDAPGGRRKLRIAPQTEWESPRVLSVVEHQGEWLAVLVPELPNGEVGWVREQDVARLDTVGWAVRADLARRVVEVERDGEVVRRFPVGIGRADHPTPPGRYAVTDKLRVTDPGSPYGCCVVALTGHQPELPPGWPGGDRLAIHATRDTSGLGEAVSLGCLRADPKDARWLMDAIPLGAPVFIERGEPARARKPAARKPAARKRSRQGKAPPRKASQGKRSRRS